MTVREYNQFGDADRSSRREDDLSDDPDEIRVEIEQTRTELSGTLDALSQRLDPDVLMEQASVVVTDVTAQAISKAKEAALEVTDHAVEQAKGGARDVTDHALEQARETAREVTGQAKDAAWDATVGRAEDAVGMAGDAMTSAGQTARGVGSIMLDTIKQNPVPAALAGLTLGWLFMNRSSSSAVSTPPPRPAGQGYSAYGTAGTSAPYGTSAQYGTAGQYGTGATYPREGERSTIGEVAGKVGETAGQAKDKAGELVSDAGEKVGDLASAAAGTAGDLAGTATHTAKQTGSSILDTIKANPIPAALTGIGLAWLYMKGSGGGSTGQGAYGGYGTSYGAGGASYPPPPLGTSGRTYGHDAGRPTYGYGTSGTYDRDRYGAGGTYDRDEDRGTVGKIADTVGDTAGQVADTAGDLAGRAQGAVGDVVGGAQGGAQWAGNRIEQMARSNPLMTAALAATIGGAVGFALPETRREDQLLGSARNSLMGQAKQATSETMDKVQQVAEGAKDVAKDQAREQGLTV